MSQRTFEGLGLMALPVAGPAPQPQTPVTNLAVDSRQVGAGALFAAIPGTRLDGAEFAQFAVRKGAVGVLATPEGAETARSDLGTLPVPVFLSDTPRAELARLAAAFWPAQPSTMVAVTGTNGKTSVVHFLRQIWEICGLRAVSVGTTGVEGAGLDEPLAVTTPEPITLHRLLDRLATRGCTHAAMEASSHALEQHRVDGVRLAAGALTNIQRDHMDYHGSAEAYVAAKMRLFGTVLPPGSAAVVHASPEGIEARRIAEARRIEVCTIGPQPADLSFEAETTPDGFRVRIDLPSGRAPGRLRSATDLPPGLETFETPLLGAFQIQNVMLAAATAIATGLGAADVLGALPKLRGVRGRMERVARRANGGQLVIDYAHTPDALVAALSALRRHVTGRLIVLGGAGGDRDRGKRPLMGRAMAEGADHVIVTDDNPRSEDPGAIRRAVLDGCPEAEEIGDRAAAILAGVDALKSPADCLLIAGKGHEQGQEIAGTHHPFDDATQARAAVAALDGDDPWDPAP
ncbi:MAG: UDP-N-acetylmuramoyl-L-alanyl-D-glutamate--2,6-diaminopimelate ligase [Pseudomonadota bacterium]